MSAEPVEIVHVVLAGSALAFSLWNVRDSRGDVKALKMLRINSAAESTARAAFRNEVLRSAQLTCLLLIGVVAFFVAPPMEPARASARLISLTLFIVFDGLIFTNTLLTLIARRKIYRQLGMNGRHAKKEG